MRKQEDAKTALVSSYLRRTIEIKFKTIHL